jgi:hypothetical protein
MTAVAKCADGKKAEGLLNVRKNLSGKRGIRKRESKRIAQFEGASFKLQAYMYMQMQVQVRLKM